MINHDKFMMINFLNFYEFLYKKYYFLAKNGLKILHENIRFFIEKFNEKNYKKCMKILWKFYEKI